MASKDRIWEANFKVDIPKIHGGIFSDSLIDWLVEIEKIWEFQSVSDDRLVSLVVKKFRGYAASWWHQVKTTRKQAGKSPIKSWAKLKQKLCAHFLPCHYGSLVYNRLQNLKRGTRVLVDYEENCHFHDNYFIDKPIHGIYNDKDNDLSSMAYVADPKLDVIVAEEGDIVNFVDNVMDVTKSDEDLINTNDMGDDGDVADRDGHDDQILNGDTSLDVRDVDDRFDSFKTILDVTEVAVLDPAYDGGEVDVQNIEFIETQGVSYEQLSPVKFGHVIKNLTEMDDDTCIASMIHHQTTNSEPPDRGRREMSFVHHEVDLYHKVYGSPVFEIFVDRIFDLSVVDNTSFEASNEYDKGIIVIGGPDNRDCLKSLCQRRLSREDFPENYKTKPKTEETHMCSSKTEFMNWDFGIENPRQIPSYPRRHVYGKDVNSKNHIDFFFTMGELTRNKRHVMDFYVNKNIIMMLLSRDIRGLSNVASNSMRLHLHTCALMTNTCKGRKVFQFFLVFFDFDVHEGADIERSNVDDYTQIVGVINLDLLPPPFTLIVVSPHGQIVSIYSSNSVLLCSRSSFHRGCHLASFVLPHINAFVELLPPIQWMSHLLCFMEAVTNVCSAKWLQEILMVERRIQVAAFQIQVNFLVGLDKVQIDSLSQDLFIGLRTCLRWKSIMFCLIEKDNGVVFKDHSGSKKSCFLVVVGSIEVVLRVGDVSRIKLLNHLQDIINVEPKSCEAFTWIDRAVSQRLLDSNSISTTFSCWSDVTCESRKLLTCGKLSFFLACFSNKLRFMAISSDLWSSSSWNVGFLTVRYMMRCHGESFDFAIACQDVLQQIQQYLKLAATTFIASMVKRFYMVFDPGDFEWVVFAKACFPLHTRSDSDNVQEEILKTEFEICYEQWHKINQENIDHVKDKLLLQHKMERLEKKLVSEKEESKRLKIKLAATQGCFCALKREDHNVLIIRLKAALVAEKEKSNQLEKELMEYERNVRMLNSGTKKLDQILSMGRLGKARCGLGYRGDISSSKTVFVPGSLSMSTGIREQPDSRPNPLPPEGT
ncbi:Retrotransposon gag domain [Arabidopsis thaliana x Arabidopsis arenosa]|uniref:Retrotransposon gag domain n=1 Tax=Arabidopsis thaliana x Arabidopsis arenosa TaxID=1240361 RepID=A0A8T1XIV2_9BRAS|nr:Retrotransposon gag domain [Arabidopsis thaliana x Arabidopsis arenosa]